MTITETNALMHYFIDKSLQLIWRCGTTKFDLRMWCTPLLPCTRHRDTTNHFLSVWPMRQAMGPHVLTVYWLRWVPLGECHCTSLMKFYYKFKRNEMPEYFASFNLHTQGSSHDYSTRQRNEVRTIEDSIPNQMLIHCMDGFASAVKQHSISKCVFECQDESC